MQKITILFSGLLFVFSLQAKEEKTFSSIVFKEPLKNSYSKIQDKNVIKGNWQRDDSAIELHISKLFDNGSLELNYLNSKFIFVEKAGWTNSSNILRLFVIYRQEDNPGYSLSLRYLAEKDLLIGAYVDGTDNKTYNVTFKRIK